MIYVLLILALQIALAAHVLRQGRSPWWIVAFIVFPGLASLIYLLSLTIDAAPPARRVSSTFSLSQLERDYRRTPTIAQALALGAALEERGQITAALRLYEEHGERDALLLQARANALLALDRAHEAGAIVDKIYSLPGSALPEQTPLLRARILAAQDDPHCEQAYRELLTRPGPEVRCHLADWLLKQQRNEEARVLYGSILESAHDNGRAYRQLYAPWIERARQGLAIMR